MRLIFGLDSGVLLEGTYGFTKQDSILPKVSNGRCCDQRYIRHSACHDEKWSRLLSCRFPFSKNKHQRKRTFPVFLGNQGWFAWESLHFPSGRGNHVLFSESRQAIHHALMRNLRCREQNSISTFHSFELSKN